MLDNKHKIADESRKKLEVMQNLDALGVGFSIASHDMDIRGSGNLLGDEQSGHVKEIGFELYQKETCGPWDVPKGATNILLFHKNAGIAEVVGEDDLYFKMYALRDKFFDRIDYFRERGMARILDSK
jgi:hypothetical protein